MAAEPAPAADAPSILDAGAGLVLALLALAWFSISWSSTLDLRDEGHILHQSSRSAAGELSHRDYPDVYGPGVFAVTGAALRLGEGSILSSRIAVGIFKALAVACSYWLARAWLPRGFALLAALWAMAFFGRPTWNLNTPYAALYTLPLCLMALVAATSRRRPPRLRAVAAGAAAGVAFLFKQTLAAYLLLGLGAALALEPESAASASAPSSREKDGSSALPRGLAVTIGVASGIAMIVPVWAFLDARSYALHLAPLHAVLLLAVVGAWKHADLRPRLESALERILLLALGQGLVLGAVAGIYLASGGLELLLFDLFVLPTTLVNYGMPVELAPPTYAFGATALCAAVWAASLALGGRVRPAGALAALAGGLGIGAVLTSGSLDPRALTPAFILQEGGDRVAGLVPGFLTLAGLAAFAPVLLRQEREPAAPRAPTPLLLLLGQGVLVFQIFPRAGFNTWVLLGAMGPLLAALLYRVHIAGAGRSPWLVLRALGLLVLLLPALWLASRPVSSVLRTHAAERVAADLPRAEGLRLTSHGARQLDLGNLSSLLVSLEKAPPGPLFLLSNQEMLLPMSGRRPLFPDLEPFFFWAGWDLLSQADLRELESEPILRALRETPGVLVIDHDDAQSRQLARSLPRLRETIDTHFEQWLRLGRYQVYRPRR